MLTEKDYKTILQFVENMPTKGDGFLRSVLRLFEEHFSVRVSLIIAYQNTAKAQNAQGERFSYIVRNLEPAQVKPYFAEYFKFDVFASRRKRKGSNVALLSQSLTEEARQSSPYVSYLHSLGIAHQACIFLREGENHLATISLFRAAADGDFTQTEMETFTILESVITRQYKQALELNRAAFLASNFDSYFADMDMGVALLGTGYEILRANKTFSEYAAYILEHGTIEDSIVTRGTVNTPLEYLSGQKLVNYFGRNIIIKPHRIHIECLFYLYHFHTKSIACQGGSSFNSVEYQHLVFLDRQEKIRSSEMLSALKLLTPREMNVISHLAEGLTNTEIADAMTISQYTVKTHLQNIYAKCNVSGRSELMAKLK